MIYKIVLMSSNRNILVQFSISKMKHKITENIFMLLRYIWLREMDDSILLFSNLMDSFRQEGFPGDPKAHGKVSFEVKVHCSKVYPIGFKTSTKRDCIASLGSPLHCWTYLKVKKFLFCLVEISHLCLLSLVLLPCASATILPLSCRYWKTAIRAPLSLLFHRHISSQIVKLEARKF